MSKKTNVWMPLYIADYLADTTRLTTEQHGAYLLLIMDYWRNGALPDDDGALANITRLSDAQWKKHRAALSRLFQIEGCEWRHKRIDAELKAAAENSAKHEERARKAAAKRWGKQCSGDATSNASSTPQEQLEECPSPSPSPNTFGIGSSSSSATTFGASNASLPPLPEPSSGAKRIGLVCRLLRSKGVHCAPSQFVGKYQGLENHSDDDFHLAVQTLQDRGQSSIGIGLIAAVLGDIAASRQQSQVTYTPRQAASSKPQQFDPTAYVNRNRTSKQQGNTHGPDDAIDGECERVA